MCRFTYVSLVLLIAAGVLAAAQKKAPSRAKKPAAAARKPAAVRKKTAKPAQKRSSARTARYRKSRRPSKSQPVDPALAALPPFPQYLGPVVPPRVPPPGVPGNFTASVARILDNAYSLLGTPYRRGGSTPDTGFDCSGFVRYVFQTSFPVGLSPSSRAQFTSGAPVRKEELAAGDLVFFKTRSRGWHVGIYVGDGQFIHSPRRNRTVTVAPLSLPYWRRYYVGARRIPLPEIAESAGNNN